MCSGSTIKNYHFKARLAMAFEEEENQKRFVFIELLILLFLLSWESLVKGLNLLGLAWWAKIETQDPHICYWFGPFVSHKALEVNLQTFILDLYNEKPKSVSLKTIQICRKEPLTNDLQMI